MYITCYMYIQCLLPVILYEQHMLCSFASSSKFSGFLSITCLQEQYFNVIEKHPFKDSKLKDVYLDLNIPLIFKVKETRPSASGAMVYQQTGNQEMNQFWNTGSGSNTASGWRSLRQNHFLSKQYVTILFQFCIFRHLSNA